MATAIMTVISGVFAYFTPENSRSLQAAQKSLHARHILYTPKQLFEEWLKLESEDTHWHTALPKCPKEIKLKDNGAGQVLVIHSDPQKWNPITNAGSLHGKASYAMRSTPVGHSSSQCTYDVDGKLYESEIPESGSADFYSPAVSKHLHHIYDVEPYILAQKLGLIPEYYRVRPVK